MLRVTWFVKAGEATADQSQHNIERESESQTMPVLDAALFAGQNRILETDISNCEVNNVGEDINDVLKDQGWAGGPVCCILLHLSPDNERVSHGVFLARGVDEKEFKVEVTKLWQDANIGVTLTVRMPELDSFVFSDGGLTSDLLPDQEVVHFYHETRDGGASAPILSTQLGEWGIGKFCLRLVCHASKNSSEGRGIMVKYYVMLFPGGRAQLEQMSAHVTNASWPGLKLGEGEMPMLPKPTRPWGCPVLPIIKPGIPFATRGRAPGSGVLRHCIAAVMSRSGAPDVSRSATSLAAKWEKTAKNPATFTTKEPPVTWPTPEALPAQTGEFCPKIYIIHIRTFGKPSWITG